MQFAVIVLANADDHHFFGIDLIDGDIADADNLLRVNQQNRKRAVRRPPRRIGYTGLL